MWCTRAGLGERLGIVLSSSLKSTGTGPAEVCNVGVPGSHRDAFFWTFCNEHEHTRMVFPVTARTFGTFGPVYRRARAQDMTPHT